MGGGEEKGKAALKAFVYTNIGSALLLFVIISFYIYSSDHSFNLITLSHQDLHRGLLTQTWFRYFCWFSLFIGIAILVPIVPFHTWFLDAIETASTPVSIILATVITKIGIYIFFRLNLSIFPEITGTFAWLLALLGTLNLIYGTCCALNEKNLRRLIAYIMIAQMGLCLLGIASFNAEGMTGAILHMVNHTIIGCLLFFVAGILLDRAHQLEIDSFGGIATFMPRYALLAALAFLAAIGMPGSASFISEILTLTGTFQAWLIPTIISLVGIIMMAVVMLKTYQKIFFGNQNELCRDWPEMSLHEMSIAVPLILVIIFFGFYPQPIIDIIHPTLYNINESLRPFVSHILTSL